jgi:hypothetical protein
MHEALIEVLQTLVGTDLAVVSFVRDYLQLEFDTAGAGSYIVTAFRLPRVRAGKQDYAPETPGYRDMLCHRIDHVVTNVIAHAQQETRFEFDDASAIAFSLTRTDYDSSEIGTLKHVLGRSTTSLAVW